MEDLLECRGINTISHGEEGKVLHTQTLMPIKSSYRKGHRMKNELPYYDTDHVATTEMNKTDGRDEVVLIAMVGYCGIDCGELNWEKKV